jgi:hypothetical protein
MGLRHPLPSLISTPTVLGRLAGDDDSCRSLCILQTHFIMSCASPTVYFYMLLWSEFLYIVGCR